MGVEKGGTSYIEQRRKGDVRVPVDLQRRKVKVRVPVDLLMRAVASGHVSPEEASDSIVKSIEEAFADGRSFHLSK